jgi:hypothetical protein
MTRKRIYLLSFITISLLATTIILWKVYQKGAQNWLAPYILSYIDGTNNIYSADAAEHLIFIVVDHHEQPFGEEAGPAAHQWISEYKSVVNGLTDDYGNQFKYTWFYPYDHKREDVLIQLNELVYNGYGEIEFHWHHELRDQDFAIQVIEAANWFTSFGAMLPIGDYSKPAFGYIAGNWNLDSGRCNNDCDASFQLDHLLDAGAYADFTFSSNSTAQPSKFSSIYYATDSKAIKSYDTGHDVTVGGKVKGLMIFEGPTALDFRDITVEHAQLEAWYGSDWPHRINLWVDNSPFVKGRPEWKFVKAYTHGVQSKELILKIKFRNLIEELIKYSSNKKLKLHFATAREAYNMVKAAEAGHSGDPELFRDYLIPPPANTTLLISQKMKSLVISDKVIEFKPDKPGFAEYRMKNSPVSRIAGSISKIRIDMTTNSPQVTVNGTGEIELSTDVDVHIINTVKNSTNSDFGTNLIVEAIPEQD